MLSMRLNEKWHAIIATAGAASRNTMGRSGPIVSAPGLGSVACYQGQRVVIPFDVAGDDGVRDLLRRVGEHERFGESVFDTVGVQHDRIARGQRNGARG